MSEKGERGLGVTKINIGTKLAFGFGQTNLYPADLRNTKNRLAFTFDEFVKAMRSWYLLGKLTCLNWHPLSSFIRLGGPKIAGKPQ